jgi:predicted neuraminidase
VELGFPQYADIGLTFNAPGSPPAVIVVPENAVHQETAVFDSIDGKIGHHAATITAFADGELLAAWYSYAGPGELDGSAIYTSRRLAGSAAWEPPQLHIDRPIGDGNPVLYSEGDNVWLFQAVVPGGWSTAHIEIQRSGDRGRTWSEPRTIDGPMGANVKYPPLRTAAGDLLLPAYDDLLSLSLFFASADGDNWTLRSAVYTDGPHENIQPSVVRLGSNRLLTVMRNKGQEWLWVMASDDDGRSWSRPQNSNFANPGSATALLRLANGHLLLVFNDSPTERRPLSAAISTDDGVTWTAAKILADGDSTYSYPAVVQTPDNLIHLLYSFGRESIRHVTLNEAWVVGD